MTKPRSKPQARFHAFIVEPSPNFQPGNWQQTPNHYRIVEYMGQHQFKGTIDAWKFLHNHKAISSGAIERWAIYLDFDQSVLTQPVSANARTDLLAFACNESLFRQFDHWQQPAQLRDNLATCLTEANQYSSD